MKQIEELNSPDKRSMLSPIPESNSSKYNTIDSYTDPNYAKRFDPNDERKISGSGSYKFDPNDDRKITGSGTYKLPNLDQADDDEYEYYSDDFESDDEDFSVRSSGCSGSTVDTSARNTGY